ncbi:hypothetical protein ABZP36_011263 [Zizania latifolia]
MRAYVMRRFDLLPRRRLAVVAVVILAALAGGGGGGGSVAVAAGKYDAAVASSARGSYSYSGAHAGATVVATLSVEDVVAPEFFPVGLVGGGHDDYISYPSIDIPNKANCLKNCAAKSGQPYTRPCTYKDRCPP